MCYIDIDDTCPVWLEQVRRARKPHQCRVCRRVIYAGETYTLHFSVYDGEPCSEKVCSFCQAGRTEFKYAHDGMEYTPGHFVQSLIDCINDDEESRTKWTPILREIEERRASRPKSPRP